MSGSSTVAIHADRDVHPSRSVARPIYQTATFWADDAEQFAQAAVDRQTQGFYTRYGNPNHAQVAAVVAELEGTEAAMVTASGMAALTSAVLTLVSAGDHVIGQKSLRLPRHNANGQALAEALNDHPAVSRVHYPGLVSHPQHALAGRQMSGFGGVLGLELAGGFEAADAFLSRLRYARRSASLGGVESLAVHPASMWRGMLSEEQIAA